MKKNTLKNQSMLRRALVSNLLLVSLLAAVLTGLYAELQRSALDQQLRLRAETLTEFLAVQSQFGMLVNDREGLRTIASNALSLEDVVFVELKSASGDSMKSSRPGTPRDAAVLSISRNVASPAAGGLLEWESGRRPAAVLGSVEVGFSTERQRRLLRQTILSGIGVVLACLLGILAAQYYQLRGLLRPLRGLIAFAGQVGKGDLKQRAPIVRMDEIGHLAAAFNQMLDELGSITVSKNYVNNILHSMAESMIVVDSTGTIRTVNQATLSLLGYREEELIGQPASMIATHAADAHECVYRLKNGREIPVLFSAARLPEGDGEVWMAQDISERKRAEEELRVAKLQAEEASRAKSDLLSRTSHELRTPLNAILGFAQLLEMGELCEMDRGNVEQILKGGRHLLKLINEVLDIAGIESGRRGLSLEAVYVRDAVAESVDLVRPLAAQRGISIHDAVQAVHWVMADRQRLQQVLINLLSNAVKYNREGGTVIIDSERRPDGSLRVLVRDTGPGIAPGDLAKVFMPFERLGAEQAGVEGTGLGLSFAKSFMEAMGGSIGVSSAPGAGATFWIDIPPAAAPDEPQFPAEGMEMGMSLAGDRRRQLLYIEDNSSNRELIERVLTHRPSIQLTTVTSGMAGVSAAREMRPDLVLLDLHLPDIWGDEVIRRLKRDAVTSTIPVIMLSADATPKQIQKLLTLGAEAYLTKPIDVRQLLAMLDEKLAAEVVC
ncbi:MAG: response regulator [Acidobacteriia bacterium]|nr:response regulator [Terriglobia bacterium]